MQTLSHCDHILTWAFSIADIVPVKKRGISLALVTGSIVPFTPYVMYAQLLAVHSTWRWTMWITLIYNGIIFISLLFTYFPKSHPAGEGVSKRRLLGEIDYVGAVLSIVGITIL